MRKWIVIALVALLVTALGLALWQLDLPNWQRLDLNRIRATPKSTVVFDANGQSAGALYAAANRRYVELKDVPGDVVNAFIAAEDQRFYSHHGFDLKRIFGALWHDLKTRSFEQGASTITQQLIKLTHLTSDKTISRKAQEIVLACQLEKVLSKEEILEAYLNTVYFGNGAYGIGAAAEAYFGKVPGELTLAEGALLAGIIKSPSKYAPHLHPENAVSRRDHILAAMAEQGLIAPEALESAAAEPLRLKAQAVDAGADGWYMDQVLLEAEAALGLEAEEILSAGLHIYTGLRTDFQQAAEALFESGANFPDPAADGTPVQAALIALDPATGEIAAVIGGRSYDVRRGLNRATQAQRQPGSAIKPVSTYAAAIEDMGFLPCSMIEDVQREFPGKYLPGNVGGKYYGTVTLREALSRSLNVATVDLADLIGMQRVRNAMAKFGIPLAAQDVNLSLSLGSMTNGVSPARLCAAYCALANGGTRVEPHAIRRITDNRGRLLYEAPAPSEAAVSPQTAFLVTDMLKTAATTGSAKALFTAGVPVAGKTGTVGESGGGNRDNWTVACTPDLAVAVWMGFDEPDARHALPDYAGGSSYPARLCAALIARVSSALSGRDFAAPENLVPLKIDRAALSEEKVVRLAASNTPEEYVQVEWFPPDRAPSAVSELWNAPEPVDDLMLLSESGDPPALAFTSRSGAADYLVLRKSGGDTEVAAVLRADAGNVIVWSDTQASTDRAYTYSVLPRHHLLYESGSLLTGLESASVSYSPGGLLNRMFGGDSQARLSPAQAVARQGPQAQCNRSADGRKCKVPEQQNEGSCPVRLCLPLRRQPLSVWACAQIHAAASACIPGSPASDQALRRMGISLYQGPM